MGNSLGYDDESVDEESLSGIVNQDEFPSLEEQAASAAAFSAVACSATSLSLASRSCRAWAWLANTLFAAAVRLTPSATDATRACSLAYVA